MIDVMPHLTRKIRSFVRREGRITAGQQRALEKYWPIYGIETTSHTLALADYFTTTQPCILEIGIGMGENLVAQAQAHPDYNFIGIEVHRPGIGKCLNALADLQLSNVRLICADAVEIIAHCIPNASLAGLLIYFPDPWPKQRHHKRRLIQAEFITQLATKLTTDGILHIATDWANYAEHIALVLSADPHWQRLTDNPLLTRARTRFAERGKRLGHSEWDFIYRKLP
jgi:tRNA (guanine-N7-)-methyltransferase